MRDEGLFIDTGCPQKNVFCQTLTDFNLGHCGVFKSLLPYENIASHRLCSKISDQSIVITIFQACYIRNKYPLCMAGDIFLDTLVDKFCNWVSIGSSMIFAKPYSFHASIVCYLIPSWLFKV